METFDVVLLLILGLLGAAAAAFFARKKLGRQEARAVEGAPLRNPAGMPAAAGHYPPQWQGGQMHQNPVVWQQQQQFTQQWQGAPGSPWPPAAGAYPLLQPGVAPGAQGAAPPQGAGWQPTEAQLARELPPELLLQGVAAQFGAAVGQHLGQAGGHKVVSVEMSPVVWTTSPAGAAALPTMMVSAVPVAGQAPMGATGPSDIPGVARLSLPSSEALQRLSGAERELARLEGELAAAAQALEVGALDPTAGKARLAQIEAEAKWLESGGVDSVGTSELSSGQQAAKDAKRRQLQRLEALFSRIDQQFQKLKQ